MSQDVLLNVQGISKFFGGFVALDNVDMQVKQGERFGLIGPNGSGKTTMINCISGALKNEKGTIEFSGKRLNGLKPSARTQLGIARSFQIPRPFHTMTVVENLGVPLEYVQQVPPSDVRRQALEILELIDMADQADHKSNELTQIDMRKLELARAMAARPRLLISDEAMAGLSHSEVDDILAILFKLNEGGITIIMIEHIMRAVMKFTERIVVLDAGRKIAEGTPDEIVKDPNVERAYLGE